jgi:hypothetical protein
MNPTRPQSSPLLNVNDPIQIHLLVETALGDSKDYEILSQEEVDDLKKQCQYLTQRIEQTRQNLAIQSKYRDAAISMAKLYGPSDKKISESPDAKKSRRSILGHNRNGSDQVREAEQERITSQRKCEELAAELFSLEKRLMEPQSKLLKHTAGILQMTHKGPKKTPKGPGNHQQPGIPGSPESMYTYSNARSSMEPIGDEFSFDERSFYKSADELDRFGNIGRDSIIGPPPKSQAREQMQIIAKTEQKLEDLNSRLREVIVKANPQRGASYAAPPPNKTTTSESLQSQLEILEKTITVIDQEHTLATRKHEESESAMEETLEELNRELRGLLLPYDPNRPEPPELTGKGLNQQLMFFQDTIGAVEVELARAGANAKNMSNQDNVEQMETVMMGLWEIIQSGEEEERQRKQQRRQTRTAQNLPEDEDDLSADEGGDLNEPFSLQGFSTKVQWLYSQATRLKDQKKVLQRQIKQQRELNNKSDASKDAELSQKIQEMERIQALLNRTEKDADSVREQLSLVMEKLDEARQQELMRDQARQGNESAAIHAAQEQLNDRNQKIAALEEELQDLKDDRSIANVELQGKIASLTQELAAVAAAQATFEASIKEKEAEVASKEQEMEDANMEIARLQTEVTIARAELDGAYGSRAQRAAEVAANPVIQKEIDDLTKRNASLIAEIAALQEKGTSSSASDEKMRTLKKELEETIEEYEQMTKASIEWEKEREQLESTIDKLRDERESLEAQLSDEKVRWLGMKSPGVDGVAQPGATSTTVLKNEFKKMMRDTRAESAKMLRVCPSYPDSLEKLTY